MLKRVSVQEVQKGLVTRTDAYLVVTMIHYPRFLKKELVDEYARELAPPKGLFDDFKAKDREIRDHNAAFEWANYETRFDLSEEGRVRLRELAQASRNHDVGLICVCRETDRCHCDLLLLWAQYSFGAPIGKIRISYPVFEERLRSGRLNGQSVVTPET